MTEMLETENLNILYPAVLPNGYNFNDFEVIDIDGQFEIRALSTEPYITFVVELGITFQIENYKHEENGIKYNVLELGDGLYQAEWIDNEDYYWIVVADEAVLSEIIKKLTR
jgi:hypothetical protein